MDNEVRIGSIRQVHRRLKCEGYKVSEYRLRLWVKEKRLSAIMVGKKALIRYADVVRLLDELLSAA